MTETLAERKKNIIELNIVHNIERYVTISILE